MTDRNRARLAVAIASLGFGAALALRDRVDPWRAAAAALWALGRHRLRGLLAVDARGLAVAAVLGVALVAATHAAFHLLAPWLAPQVSGLYASIATVSRGAQAAVAFAVVVVEELVWRGCALEVGRPRAPLAVALYVLPQIVGGAWVLVVAALALGTILTAQRVRTHRLLDPLVTHAIWSVAIFVVVPLTR